MQRAPLDWLDEQMEALNRAMAGSLRALRGAAPADEGQAPWPGLSTVSPPVASPTRPLTRAVALWDTMPGLDHRGAAVSVAELGLARARLATAPRLAASAGKQRAGTTRQGNRPRRARLPPRAHAAVRTQGTSLSALDQRLAARRGKHRALVAVAHVSMCSVLHRLARQEPYRALGANYFDERRRHSTGDRLARRIEHLGSRVHLKPVTPSVA